MKTLYGKTVLVTGGSRGIGASSAYQLADAGANIAITYSSSAEEAEEEVSRLEDSASKLELTRPMRPNLNLYLRLSIKS